MREAYTCIYDDPAYDVCEGLIAAEKHGKYGYLNVDHEIIIPFNYDHARDFSEGFAVVSKYGKYRYVDRFDNDTFN